MSEPPLPSDQRGHIPRRTWARKFGDAFRGVAEAVREQNSFRAHFVVAAAVVVCAAAFRVSLVEWCILLVCITVVFTAELFNTALEGIAKVITDEHDPVLGLALDIASAAVLLAAFGSAVVGGIIFLRQLGQALGWW